MVGGGYWPGARLPAFRFPNQSSVSGKAFCFVQYLSILTLYIPFMSLVYFFS